MTDYLVFEERSIVGGGGKDKDEEIERGIEEPQMKGGFAVSELYKKGDNQSSTFWDNLVVPIGLVYRPIVTVPYEEDTSENTCCEYFDRLFFLSAKNLDKSKARKTRKKMTS
jgi:hypothetical protein